ncbi:LysR family transcriptional regulator [Corallococcus sp. AB004]|uniref:LysR family transcriptional regulator n=1 Tax=Corallococcus exiguus TaxID=83462 RepID=A0A7X4YD35_9BACT|nr:LysR family transcriptional regulator [Corallococcus exiguus]NBC43233.1 LysR family transcriptional regulator [Corallococcus exiguus]NRD45163.1 LysR family transcriptional regulator [Corallococcus exiguus]RKI44126.1 LysR family transcriptional regulator [Corallococcus sp. AB004]TNV56647.1 LysR family transcriptional regulator [Corallococcus exiguus]
MADLDLNLLVALDALLREGSVARAADRLGLSAPAMSRTLTRIRTALGDPVLVRAGRGLVPTPRALALQEKVRAVVRDATALLAPGTPTAPEQLTRTLTLRVNDGVIPLLGTTLHQRARAEAPGLTLRFVAEGLEDVESLRDGEVDLDIGVQGALGPEIRVQRLGEESFMCLVGRASPLARGRLTLERFARAEHVGVSRRGKLRTPLDDVLEQHGHSRRVTAVVPNMLAAAALVAGTDAVTTVNGAFARAAARLMPVKARPVPLPLPRVTVAQAWHPRFDRDPAHVWLRRTVKALCEGPMFGATP